MVNANLRITRHSLLFLLLLVPFPVPLFPIPSCPFSSAHTSLTHLFPPLLAVGSSLRTSHQHPRLRLRAAPTLCYLPPPITPVQLVQEIYNLEFLLPLKTPSKKTGRESNACF